MAQAATSPIAYYGPWNGLNTAVDPRNLPPGSAQRAYNVNLSERRIRPRAPWANIFNSSHWLGETPLSMVQVRIPNDVLGTSADYLIYKAIQRSTGSTAIPVLQSVNLDTANGVGDPVNLQSGAALTFYPADFVIGNGWVYVLDGGDVIYKTKGTPATTRRAGLLQPQDPIVFNVVQAGPGTANPITQVTHAWRVTYYDDETGVESSMGVPAGGVDFTLVRAFDNDIARFSLREPPPEATKDANISHFRIYRKNLTLSQVGYRLVDTVAWAGVGSGTILWEDSWAVEDDVTASNLVSGPWGPTRNDPVTGATVGAIFNDRMYFSRKLANEPGRVRYTPIGVYDYMHDSDFIAVRGDKDERISGLADFGGQLVIGKRDTNWIHGGVVGGHTNDTIATGALPIQGNASTFKSKSDTGPLSSFANGFVVAGEPARLWYASTQGFAYFDGSSSVIVSRAVKPTWRKFVSAGPETNPTLGETQGVPTFSYAVDRQNGTIIICSSHAGVAAESGAESFIGTPNGMVLHYSVEGWGWSTVEPKRRVGGGDVGPMRCVCTSVSERPLHFNTIDGVTPYQLISYYIGTARVRSDQNEGYILGSVLDRLAVVDYDPSPAAQELLPDYGIEPSPKVDFSYVTGRLSVTQGRRKHFYLLKHLFVQSDSVSEAAEFGYRMDGGPDVVIRRSMSDARGEVKQPVRRTGRDITVVFKQAPVGSVGWDYMSGYAGYEIDVELASQR